MSLKDCIVKMLHNSSDSFLYTVGDLIEEDRLTEANGVLSTVMKRGINEESPHYDSALLTVEWLAEIKTKTKTDCEEARKATSSQVWASVFAAEYRDSVSTNPQFFYNSEGPPISEVEEWCKKAHQATFLLSEIDRRK